MVDEEHLLALEEDGEDQPANQDPDEAADEDQEEEDGDMQVCAEDFTDVDVLRDEDEEMESGAGEHLEHDQLVTEKTSEEELEEPDELEATGLVLDLGQRTRTPEPLPAKSISEKPKILFKGVLVS